MRHARGGEYKLQPGTMVYTCFTSDFLLEDADAWRPEAWAMMRARADLVFLFITKRIDRFAEALPPDWGDGYPNVVVGCTVENQAMAEYRLPIFGMRPSGISFSPVSRCWNGSILRRIWGRGWSR